MSYLDDLLGSTRARIEEAKQLLSEEELDQRIAAGGAPRGFARALEGDEVAIIAEIKRTSPAKGILDPDLKAGALARAYANGGAAAISVVTEPDHFHGSLDDLVAAKPAGLPVLRKDFILDEIQVMEARAAGADALLVIVKAVGDELGALISAIELLGMDALVEVNDDGELGRALDAGATLIGVNHRNLVTFEVDADLTAKLAPRVPEDCALVALSGVSQRSEVEGLAEAGATAVLVGEALVTSGDPAARLRELRGLQ